MNDCKCNCDFVQTEATTNEPPTITTTYGWISDQGGYCPELVGKKVRVFIATPEPVVLAGEVKKVTDDYILLDSGFVEFRYVSHITIEEAV